MIWTKCSFSRWCFGLVLCQYITGQLWNLQLCLRALLVTTRPQLKVRTNQGRNAAAAAAKCLQSCLTLCDAIDGCPPGSPVPGILQARTLEWVAISFSNEWKWKVKVKSLSRARLWLFETPWTAAYQAPPSMGFSRQEYWSWVPLPSPNQGRNKTEQKGMWSGSKCKYKKFTFEKWHNIIYHFWKSNRGLDNKNSLPLFVFKIENSY